MKHRRLFFCVSFVCFVYFVVKNQILPEDQSERFWEDQFCRQDARQHVIARPHRHADLEIPRVIPRAFESLKTER